MRIWAFKQIIKAEAKKHNYSNLNFCPCGSDRSQITGTNFKADCVTNQGIASIKLSGNLPINNIEKRENRIFFKKATYQRSEIYFRALYGR